MRGTTTTRPGPVHRATRRPPGRLDSHTPRTDRGGLVTINNTDPTGRAFLSPLAACFASLGLSAIAAVGLVASVASIPATGPIGAAAAIGIWTSSVGYVGGGVLAADTCDEPLGDLLYG